MEKNRKRVEYLDILKTIAIFLVCFCHFIYLKNDYICAFVMLVAWSAVPIFFIVNGFLLFKKEFDLDKHIKKIRSVFFCFYSLESNLLNNRINII